MTLAEQREAILHNASLVAARAAASSGAECKFDRAAVVWLEAHIRELREEILRLRPETRQAQIDGLGGVLYPFFGECVARTYGGEWAVVNGYWAISLGKGAAVFPQKKIYKSLEGDPTESPLSYFDSIPRLLGL